MGERFVLQGSRSLCRNRLQCWQRVRVRLIENINFYLAPGPNVFAEPRKLPLRKDTSPMLLGNLPRDGGLLTLTQEEHTELLKREPAARKFIRRYIGSYELINNKTRYCLWLVDATPHELRSIRFIRDRVRAVKAFRLASKRAATQKLADTSWLFAEIRQPDRNYLAIPLTSSERRSYVPMDFLSPDVIASNAISIIPDAGIYDFGILTSRVHMAWMRAVCGRLEISYRYAGTLAYNTFPWPEPDETHKSRIESTAQVILDTRAQRPDSSFADLYDDDFMPAELREAHRLNDAAVCEAYGWDENISETDIVANLFTLYEKLTRQE